MTSVAIDAKTTLTDRDEHGVFPHCTFIVLAGATDKGTSSIVGEREAAQFPNEVASYRGTNRHPIVLSEDRKWYWCACQFPHAAML